MTGVVVELCSRTGSSILSDKSNSRRRSVWDIEAKLESTKVLAKIYHVLIGRPLFPGSWLRLSGRLKSGVLTSSSNLKHGGTSSRK